MRNTIICRLLSMLIMLALVVPHTARAEPINAADAASRFVEALGAQAITTMRSPTLSQTQKQQNLEGLFVASVDVPWVAKFALGRYWKEASDAQKQEYSQAYQSFIIKHYTAKFADYAGRDLKLTGAEQDAQGNYLVGMNVLPLHPDEPQIQLSYRVRQMADGQFKVFDVIVEGVSLITTQRTEFASIVGEKGLDYLIGELTKKTMEASILSPKKSG